MIFSPFITTEARRTRRECKKNLKSGHYRLKRLREFFDVLALVFWSDGPGGCTLIKKTIQDRRKNGSHDYSQDPNGLGVYLWRAGNNYEAGKSDQTRHATHGKSNKHADDNLLHDIPSSACDLPIHEPLH